MGKSLYTDELATEICNRIAEGEPLRQICRESHMPGWVTVYNWINTRPDFAERFARARDLGADAIAESCLEIADDATNDWMLKTDREGNAAGWQLNNEHVQRSKLRIETRLKLLAKWNPKKYGESQKIEMAGQLSVNQMTEEEMRAELAALGAADLINPPSGADDDCSDLV